MTGLRVRIELTSELEDAIRDVLEEFHAAYDFPVPENGAAGSISAIVAAMEAKGRFRLEVVVGPGGARCGGGC